jgi:uncharacterized protein DUF6279
MRIVSLLGRIIGLLAAATTLAAALSSCSAVKLGYNNLAEVAYWWMDSYVDFSDEQATRVREDLARLHLWHRTHELPRLSLMLHEMEELAPNDITPTQACVFVTQLRERFNAAADQAEPAVITLAIDLAPEQLLHLERKYATKNAEYRKEWLRPSPAEQAEKRFKLFVERSETIYGSLDAPQRAVLRRQLEPSIFDAHQILAGRLRRQQDALETLRKVAGHPTSFGDARSLLRDYLARSQDPPDPDQRRYQQALIEEGCRVFAGLHNSTSAAQRQAAVRRLRGYQRDLRELAAQR